MDYKKFKNLPEILVDDMDMVKIEDWWGKNNKRLKRENKFPNVPFDRFKITKQYKTTPLHKMSIGKDDTLLTSIYEITDSGLVLHVFDGNKGLYLFTGECNFITNKITFLEIDKAFDKIFFMNNEWFKTVLNVEMGTYMRVLSYISFAEVKVQPRQKTSNNTNIQSKKKSNTTVNHKKTLVRRTYSVQNLMENRETHREYNRTAKVWVVRGYTRSNGTYVKPQLRGEDKDKYKIDDISGGIYRI